MLSVGVGAGSGLVGDVSVSEMVAADLCAPARFGAMCLPLFFLMISRLYSQYIDVQGAVSRNLDFSKFSVDI